MKEEFNNEEEKLRSTVKENGINFTVPSGYFETLPGKIMDKINSIPDFEKAPEKNPFTVPSGYFENLPSEVARNLSPKESRFYHWLNSLQRPRIAIPIAFATMIFLAGLYFYSQKKIIYLPQQEFTAEELKNSSYLQSIEEDMLVEFLDNSKNFESNDSLEQYLIDNDIDLTQIENEL